MKKKKGVLLSIVGILLFFSPHLIPNQKNCFERISIEDGLSQGTINCIFQDSHGFMWFGTQDGLNRYDGYEFSVFRHEPQNKTSISDNYIWSIFEDNRGSLWIGTQIGLNKFNPKTETFTCYRNRPDNPRSLSNNYVRSILEDSAGSLWIGTKNGLNKFDKRTETFTHYRNQPANPRSLSHNTVWSMFKDTDGNLWIGTQNGLNKLDPKTETFTCYHFQADNPRNLSSDIVLSIFEDSGGNLWIGTQNGLNKLDKRTETFTRYKNRPDDPNSISSNIIRSISEDTCGNIWLGTDGAGLNRLDPKTNTFMCFRYQADEPRGISNDMVWSIFEDAGGLLWIGTQKGLNKFDPKLEFFLGYHHQSANPRSLSHNMVWSIFNDNGGNVWIGTQNGLNKFNRETQTFTCYHFQADNPRSLSSDIVLSIFEDSGGNLWIGTQNGLNKFNRTTQTFNRYHNLADNPRSLSHNTILVIFEDTGGNLWIGTQNGLNIFDQRTQVFSRYLHQADNPRSLSNNVVTSIIEDAGGKLWIATGNGLNRFDKKKGTFTVFKYQRKNSEYLIGDGLNSLHEDSAGNLWIGTYGGGLQKFDPDTQTFTHYSKKDGLANNVVFGILEDNSGNLWISTNDGISRFNPETKQFSNYGQKDGLQSNEFNQGAYHKDKKGRMYFGGMKGFNEFFPDSVKDNTYVPPVVITGFLLFNKPVGIAKTGNGSTRFHLQQHINYTETITLGHRDYIFSFGFSALNYRQPEKNQYQYKLEGLDKDWIETDSKNRRATYTDLSHGKYRFRVMASNDDGVWNEEGASIKVIILPPFWKTWWFKSVMILFGFAALFFIFNSRIKSIKKRQKELSQRYEEKKEAAERLKKALDEVEKLKNKLQAENIYLKDEIKLNHNFSNIINGSSAFKKILRQVEQVASTDSTVLIIGETGTGKELIARAIHSISSRKDRPLIKIDCSVLPPTLIESELFGHEKGAFTGANSKKAGRFELAHMGTIFMDEIGELPPELQVKLLRVLQEGQFERLGNPATLTIDVRIIAATNRDLEKEVAEGRFRKDLFYRLNVFPLSVPPLRQRKEDIPLLINFFIQKFSAKLGKKIEKVSRHTLQILQDYRWPGNVRELENIIERAVIVSPGDQLVLGDWFNQNINQEGDFLIPTFEENEKVFIMKVLQKTGWRISGENGAARLLGLPASTLSSKMRKLGIKNPGKF